MRPIELKIKGINSYREEQVINFNQLTSQGFFGIFGPTGSGKSTILDAITLALYAKLPRGSKNFININETSASVSFHFSITTTETKEYLVERSFRYPGKDRSSTARNTTARLSLLSDIDTEVLADKPTDVTRSCTDLLGLSSDDFLRTVVLPQGQFSDFLKLKNQERRGMLQRIFHLERYGIELTRKVAAARQRMDIEVSSSEGQLQAYDDISKEALDNISSELVELKENLEKEELTEKELSEKYQLLNELKELKAEYDKYPYGKPQTDEVARGSGNREYGCRRLREKLPNFSGVSFFRAGNSNSLTNAFHICVYVHLCVVPRYIASQHPWKQSQSLLQNTKETTAGHFRRSVFLLSGRIPGVHELLWKAASLSCGRYR